MAITITNPIREEVVPRETHTIRKETLACLSREAVTHHPIREGIQADLIREVVSQEALDLIREGIQLDLMEGGSKGGSKEV